MNRRSNDERGRGSVSVRPVKIVSRTRRSASARRYSASTMRIGLPMLTGTASPRSWPTLSTMACAQRSASLKTTLRGTFVSSETIVETLIRQPRDARASPSAPPAATALLGIRRPGRIRASLLSATVSFSSASLGKRRFQHPRLVRLDFGQHLVFGDAPEEHEKSRRPFRDRQTKFRYEIIADA